MSATQRWTLTVVCAATAMLMLDIAVVNTALSAIADDLDTGLSGLQWVVDAYTLPLAATVITAGSLADRFGRRRLFLVGLGLFTATSLLCAAAQSIAMLNASRAAQGVGAAIMFAVSLAVLSNAFPRREERVRALAAYGATMGGSFAVGPLVGGALTSALGWRWIFLINLPLGLLCLSIVRRFVAESMDPRAARVDRPGLVTLTGGLFLLVFALLRGNEVGWARRSWPAWAARSSCWARSSPWRRAWRTRCFRCASSATRRSRVRRSAPSASPPRCSRCGST
jgi:MFS family permease